MELIVLYGPNNSGKTTSLKIVYEVLKSINIKETNVFRYVDRTWFLDFLDALELNPAFTKTCIDKCLDNSTSYSMPIKYDKNNINNIKKDMSSIMPDTDSITLSDNYLDTLDKETIPTSTTDTKRIGIELEGDYGDDHNENSLNHLLEELRLKKCEIIICACRNTPKPTKSLINFVTTNGATAYFIPTSALSFPAALMVNAGKVLYVLKSIL